MLAIKVSMVVLAAHRSASGHGQSHNGRRQSQRVSDGHTSFVTCHSFGPIRRFNGPFTPRRNMMGLAGTLSVLTDNSNVTYHPDTSSLLVVRLAENYSPAPS